MCLKVFYEVFKNNGDINSLRSFNNFMHRLDLLIRSEFLKLATVAIKISIEIL